MRFSSPIDVKDYYMEGRHEDFLRYSTKYVESQWQPTYKALLEFLLKSQYIAPARVQHVAWLVIKGAGMGLGFSGEFAI